ncbi:MAG: hypothetical protein A2W90_20630 [Bacteroidetes bacterium GWF2_42_66]|nr:MAG: hypothetical protein A2W92_13420 [Bacteroidetes bacterium GWA2_42_15]OFX98516.1 MAG: hypothetical protein A2W89_08995 [Bacteroidetes bacterium GWE2_42_39]OFY42900.1 MAG: hypothetical protein A2W90_20630 [Bacteroidetes bacterium GWF2_42_66]
MHIQAQTPTCLTSSATYQNQSFESKSGTFEATFDATPLANSIDVVAGLSAIAATAHSDVACGVRFKLDGTIVARNGGAWNAASTIPYTANTSYRFRLVVDIQSHIFNIYVTPQGGSELTVGANYAFRTEQAGVSSLAYLNLSDVEAHGTAKVCNFAISGSSVPSDPCITSSTSFQGRSFERQSGTFEATFDVTPLLASIDVVTGLSTNAATTASNMACIVRFNLEGAIVARDGGAFKSASTIPYAPNTSYHFRLVVNIPAHTYSIYVKPQGGSELPVGIDYAFRTEQAAASSLAYWNVADVEAHGAAKVCNFAFGAASVPSDPSCVTSSSTCQNISFSSQSGKFEATFKASPLANSIDVVVGLSAGQASSAADMACIIRFALSSQIIGRNGGAWSWEPNISYTSNTNYRFRLVVDVAAKTYNIYATPAGGSEVCIGTNYAFRAQASSLAYWSIVDVEGHGTITACDFAISPSTAVAPNIALNANEVNLSAYPNPSSDQITIKYILNEPGNVSLSLYDMSGRQLTTIEDACKEKGVHEKRYDVRAFPNGTYYINLIQEGRSSGSCKLIKQSKY